MNNTFAEDIQKWSKICQHLNIWDYVTNFQHYMLPNPNLRTLGANLRFFVKHGVYGVFEQGSFQSKGGEFAVLRAWVLAKLLWNPQLEDKTLIREFVLGYYGNAAPFIMEYINLLHNEAEKPENSIYCNQDLPYPPFLSPCIMQQADCLLDKAEEAVKNNPVLSKRVRLVHASIEYAILKNYALYSKIDLLSKSKIQKATFKPYKIYLNDFISICEANNVRILSEQGLSLRNFKALTDFTSMNAEFPSVSIEKKDDECFDLQQDNFKLYRIGKWVEIRKDNLASDGIAVWMPGTHEAWATQIALPFFADKVPGEWDIYLYTRVKHKAESKAVDIAFKCGIYNNGEKKDISNNTVTIAETAEEKYISYKVGVSSLNHPRAYIWIAPAKNNDKIDGIWIDRIVFTKKQPENAGYSR